MGTTRIVLRGGTVWVPLPSQPKRKEGEHKDGGSRSYGVVYANDLARAVLMGNKPSAVYPVGSIIVREKLNAPGDAQPQMLAVMIKRERGFNKKGGDWEFITVDGAMKKIEERQTNGSCLKCHAVQRDRDYVFPPPEGRQ